MQVWLELGPAGIWLLMVVAAALVVGAFGFAGRAAWGRTVLMAAWVAEIVVPWGIIASSAPGDFARSEVPVALQAVNTLILLAFLAYARRRKAGRAVAT